MSAELDELRASFRGRLEERVREIEAAWEAAAIGGGGGDGAPAALALLLRLAHSLYGAAGTFGYPAAGEAARALELGVRAVLNAPGAPGAPAASDLAALGPLVAALRDAL